MNITLDNVVLVLLVVAWCILPTFFWVRGEWKQKGSDRVAGGLCAMVLGYLTLAVHPGDATGINCGGYWMMLMGIFTLCHHGMRRRVASKGAFARGIGMLLGGLLLAALWI